MPSYDLLEPLKMVWKLNLDIDLQLIYMKVQYLGVTLEVTISYISLSMGQPAIMVLRITCTFGEVHIPQKHKSGMMCLIRASSVGVRSLISSASTCQQENPEGFPFL